MARKPRKVKEIDPITAEFWRKSFDWSLSDRQIAKQMCVTGPTVSRIRERLGIPKREHKGGASSHVGYRPKMNQTTRDAFSELLASSEQMLRELSKNGGDVQVIDSANDAIKKSKYTLGIEEVKIEE